METVDRWTRAGKSGKEISCPECSTVVTVYHFGWYALQCQDCGRMVDKAEWKLYA